MNRDRHDPERYYHCDCLEDEDKEEHDPKQYYHCDCIENGYGLEEE